MILLPQTLQEVFSWLIRSSFHGTILLAIILLVRAVVKKQFRFQMVYWLWMLLLLRLIWPLNVQTAFSVFNLIPQTGRPDQYLSSQAAEEPRKSISLDSDTLVVSTDISEPSSAIAPAEVSISQPEQTTPVGTKPLATAAKRPVLDWPQALCTVWLIGAAVMAGYVLFCNYRLWRIIKRQRLVTRQAILDLLEDCKAQLGLQTVVGVVETDKIKTPCLFGYLRPRLLLPTGTLEQLTPEQMRYVFLHELAHLKRHDIFIGWLMATVQVLHWFNPAVWFAMVQINADRELACDELALSTLKENEPQAYGSTILTFLERFSRQQKLPAMAGIAENQSLLRRRLTMIATFKNKKASFIPAVVIMLLLAATTFTSARSIEERMETSSSEDVPEWISVEDEQGPSGYALKFDGVSNFVRVPNNPSLEPKDEMTIEMWAYIDGQQALQTRLLRKAADMGAGYLLATDQGRDGRMQVRFDDGRRTIRSADPAKHTDYIGSWHHFTGVYAKDYVAFYVDGKLMDKQPHGPQYIMHSPVDLYIGHGAPGGPTEYFKGMIDEVRIWNIARTEQQIKDNMNSPVPSNSSGLAAYWKFDEGQGTIAHDSTSHQNHGRLEYSPKKPFKNIAAAPGNTDTGADADKASSNKAKPEILENDDGKSTGKKSIAGSGHAVFFETKQKSELVAVMLYGSRYGYDRAPKEKFHIWLCDVNQEVIKDFQLPYGTFKKGNPKWVKMRVQKTELPEQFYICAGFNAEQTKGVYVHYDGEASGNSYKGLPGQGFEEFDGGDWMIRAVVRPFDEKTSTSVASSDVMAANDLQGMIDAAEPGATVEIPAGTYDQPVKITKSLRLAGDPDGKTVIKVTANEPAILIDTEGKGTVQIKDLTIQWQLATSDKHEMPFAVAVKDADAFIENCTFKPLGNPQRSPVAIRSMGFSKMIIFGCDFTGFDYVVCYGEGTKGRMADCFIRNCGHQGVILYRGAEATVAGNIITGSKYHAVRTTGGKLTMRDNLIINNKNRGVYLGNKSGSGIIENNLLIGNGSGIDGMSACRFEVKNNIILKSTYSAISARPYAELTIRNNVLADNERGIIVHQEEGKTDPVKSRLAKNVFWNNTTDIENIEGDDTVTQEPDFVEPAKGNFTLTDPEFEGLGLKDPKAIFDLWQKYKESK